MVNSTFTTNACPQSNTPFPVYPAQQTLGLSIFTIGLQVVIGLLGTIGNVAVCVTIFRRPNALSAVRHYVLSLAFADIGVLVLNLPIAVLKQQRIPFTWVLGEAFCRYIVPAAETFYGASVWSIAAIAIKRYAIIAVKTPNIGRKRSTKKTWLAVAAVWATSFVVTSVPLYVFQTYDRCDSTCYPTWSASFAQIYILAMTMLLYLLPLVAIALSYQCVDKTVANSAKALAADSQLTEVNTSDHSSAADPPCSKRITPQKKKTLRILTPLVLLFAVTMLPLTVFRLVVMFWADLVWKSYYPTLITLVVFSTVLNSASNPFVYCVVSQEFRRELRSAIRLPGRRLDVAN